MGGYSATDLMVIRSDFDRAFKVLQQRVGKKVLPEVQALLVRAVNDFWKFHDDFPGRKAKWITLCCELMFDVKKKLVFDAVFPVGYLEKALESTLLDKLNSYMSTQTIAAGPKAFAKDIFTCAHTFFCVNGNEAGRKSFSTMLRKHRQALKRKKPYLKFLDEVLKDLKRRKAWE